jgi:hypothetical protein
MNRRCLAAVAAALLSFVATAAAQGTLFYTLMQQPATTPPFTLSGEAMEGISRTRLPIATRQAIVGVLLETKPGLAASFEPVGE